MGSINLASKISSFLVLCVILCCVLTCMHTHMLAKHAPPPHAEHAHVDMCTFTHTGLIKVIPVLISMQSLLLFLFLVQVAALGLVLLPLKLIINFVLDIKWCMCKEMARPASAPCVGLLMIRALLTISVTIWNMGTLLTLALQKTRGKYYWKHPSSAVYIHTSYELLTCMHCFSTLLHTWPFLCHTISD